MILNGCCILQIVFIWVFEPLNAQSSTSAGLSARASQLAENNTSVLWMVVLTLVQIKLAPVNQTYIVNTQKNNHPSITEAKEHCSILVCSSHLRRFIYRWQLLIIWSCLEETILMNRDRFGSSHLWGYEGDEEQCMVILNPGSGCGCCRSTAIRSSFKSKTGEGRSATRSIEIWSLSDNSCNSIFGSSGP